MSDTIAVPGVPGAVYKTAIINGTKYRYIVGLPETAPVDTVLLIHGFPDLAIGWRHQIAPLTRLGYRVIIPDQIGYGGSDAPEPLEKYSIKSVLDDLSALVKLEVGDDTAQILLGGHDWGGFAAWRFAIWHPEFIKAIFVICTPYIPPEETFHEIDLLVKTERFASFGYQIQFRDGEVEKHATDEKKIRGFLAQLFGAQKPEGGYYFSVKDGANLAELENSQSSPIVPAEDLDVYAKEMARNGLRGPLNWYRTRKINFDEERTLDREHVFKIPALFIQPLDDKALLPKIAVGMEKYFENLEWEKIKAGHWPMIQVPDHVNAILEKWLKKEKIVSISHI